MLSELDSGDPVTRSLAVGGSPSPSATSSSGLWETVGYLHFYAGHAHRMKLYARSKFDEVNAGQSASSFGAFTYNSLADLESNRPASFTRTFATPARSASAWLGAFSVGDLWQVSPNFQLQPGVRFEANHFLTAPTENPAVATAFGVSNTSLPNTMHASPRLGFVWTYRQDRWAPSYGSNALGRIWLPALGVLSGGIGEFRNDISASSALNPISFTGLADGQQQITCIGAAAPTPDWRRYARDPSSIPTQCAGGAAPVFSDAKPNVSLFDPSYSLPRSWRANLHWTGPYPRRLPYTIDAVYSYNVNQPGFRDLNFAGTPRFSLDNEGGRPVFAMPGSIVPSTGVVAIADARRSASFGRVVESVSDLHSTARLVTLSVSPIVDQDGGARHVHVERCARIRARVRRLDVRISARAGVRPRAIRRETQISHFARPSNRLDRRVVVLEIELGRAVHADRRLRHQRRRLRQRSRVRLRSGARRGRIGIERTSFIACLRSVAGARLPVAANR